MPDIIEQDGVVVSVRVESHAIVDWLIRSAVPECISPIGLEEDAQWLRVLPPYTGHTSTGHVDGWAGAVTRLRRAQDVLDEQYSSLLGMNNARIDFPITQEEQAVRRACVVARRELFPSRLGYHAYRIIDGAFNVCDRAFMVHGDMAAESGRGDLDDYRQDRAQEWAQLLDDLRTRGYASTDGAEG